MTTRARLKTILIEELERADGLPPNAAEHIARLKLGHDTPGIAAALRAMELALREAGLHVD